MSEQRKLPKREEHPIYDKAQILQEDLIILNVPNTRAEKYVKQKLIELVLKAELNNGNFNNFLTIVRTTGQKISQDVQELNITSRNSI